jgi:hypothetical protein
MVSYSVRADAARGEHGAITEYHFGVNLVTIYDEEFVLNDPALRHNVMDLGAISLRFPGGSATEFYFDMANPNASVSSYDPAETLTPMDAFFERAAEVGVDATIVIPTRLAFGVTAGAAMIDGTYSTRQDLSAAYVAELEQFVRQAVEYARLHGVQINAFEIGNEFWGSGQMTATEYGWVAGQVSVLLDQILEDEAYFSQIGVQSTSAASKIFSSRNDVSVYVDLSGPQEVFLTAAEAEAAFSAAELASWTQVTLDGQGTAAMQVTQIVASVNAVSGAADAIGAVVQHSYETGGFDAVDGGKDFKYSQFQAFADLLDRSGDSPELDFHMTEWNTRSYGAEHNRGLQNASMMIENFYEMVTNSIDAAQIWPLSFDRAQALSLVDNDEDDLAIAGEMFALMSESLVGLDPILDWSVSGVIDVHGFASDTTTVLFVSERSGARTDDVTLDLSAILDGDYHYVTVTQLWDGGAGGDDANAEPVLTESSRLLSDADTLVFDIDAWANVRIVLEEDPLSAVGPVAPSSTAGAAFDQGYLPPGQTNSDSSSDSDTWL